MHIGAAFVTDGEPAKPMEPGVRALDEPSQDPEAAAMRRPPTRQHRNDPTSAQAVAMRLGVIASVTLQHPREPLRPPAAAANGRQRVDQWVELRDVIDVGGRDLRD